MLVLLMLLIFVFLMGIFFFLEFFVEGFKVFKCVGFDYDIDFVGVYDDVLNLVEYFLFCFFNFFFGVCCYDW